MRTKLRLLLAAMVVAVLGAHGDHVWAKAAKGPPPLPLPTPKKKKPKKTAPAPSPTPVATGPTDCMYSLDGRMDPGDSTEVENSDRDVPGGKADNNAGLTILRQAEGVGDKTEMRRMWIDAVRTLLEGLQKDPYNPNLNYNLAAAYARLGKRGCMLKFVKRVVSLTKRKDTQEQANLRYTHLTKGFPGEKPPRPPDPDFNDYRDDPDFRAIVYDEAGQD